ncbi:hypothetical protein AAFF_G00220660 [Aldrovandia affinis]|uniref:Uncharacterized protein n=1 Tax=Aldrovandia affinis TaxID=143900 RepID=A0AAD7RG76_9TELE|nr:hypothetical protein AAFF_G00220660 [Aldrovandia affinis]
MSAGTPSPSTASHIIPDHVLEYWIMLCHLSLTRRRLPLLATDEFKAHTASLHFNRALDASTMLSLITVTA